MPSIGPLELMLVLVIGLVIFGPKRLPELGRGMGTGMREFKRSITGESGSAPQHPAPTARDPEPARPPEDRELRLDS